MGSKLLWSGLTFMMALSVMPVIPEAKVVGAVLMIFGLVLLWLDR